MLQRLLWNDIARGGVLLGLTMSGFKVLDISLLLSGSANFVTLTSISNITSFVIYILLLRYLVLKFIVKLPKGMSFTYMQSLSFISITSILASIWVAVVSTCMINQVVGFEAYVDSYIATLNTMAQSVDSASEAVSQLFTSTIEAIKESQKPNIIDTLFATAFIYIIKSLVVGVPLSFLVKHSGEVEDKKVE